MNMKKVIFIRKQMRVIRQQIIADWYFYNIGYFWKSNINFPIDMQKVRSFFHQFDMFAALPTLRAKKQSQTTNTCGGVLSLIFLIFFFYMFINDTIRTATYEEIDVSVTQKQSLKGIQNKIQNLVLAFGIQDATQEEIASIIRYQVNYIQKHQNGEITSRPLEIQPCTLSYFQALGDQAQSLFKQNKLSDLYCLKKNQNAILQNPFQSHTFQYIQALFSACNIEGQCMTYQQIIEQSDQQIQNRYYFTGVLYFIDTSFHPLQKEPTKPFLNSLRLIFSARLGGEVIAFLEPYQIETDQSFLPIKTIKQESGYSLSKEVHNSFQTVQYYPFGYFVICLDSKQKLIERTYGKFDEVLSYAGGLFGIIISFLAFFMMSFNQYRYELMVAEGAFNYSDDGKRVREQDFHFLFYVKYAIYDWIKTLLCCEPKWQDCEEVDETREQSNGQLDVQTIFKRMQHLERVVDYLISEKQKISLYLIQPPSLKEIRRGRMLTEYYNKIIGGGKAVTVEDIQVNENIENIFSLAQVLGFQNSRESGSRRQLYISDFNSKRTLNEEVEETRNNILEVALEGLDEKLKKENENVELDEEQLELQLDIAKAFFTMPISSRRKIQEKIPIKILYRLKKRYQVISSQETINLEFQS